MPAAVATRRSMTWRTVRTTLMSFTMSARALELFNPSRVKYCWCWACWCSILEIWNKANQFKMSSGQERNLVRDTKFDTRHSTYLGLTWFQHVMYVAKPFFALVLHFFFHVWHSRFQVFDFILVKFGQVVHLFFQPFGSEPFFNESLVQVSHFLLNHFLQEVERIWAREKVKIRGDNLTDKIESHPCLWQGLDMLSAEYLCAYKACLDGFNLLPKAVSVVFPGLELSVDRFQGRWRHCSTSTAAHTGTAAGPGGARWRGRRLASLPVSTSTTGNWLAGDWRAFRTLLQRDEALMMTEVSLHSESIGVCVFRTTDRLLRNPELREHRVASGRA